MTTTRAQEARTMTKDELCVNTIRTLAMDAVQQAHSGHPGTPMALAPVAYCLWQRFLRFDPEHPIWPNRDRFVLSVGHASMLLYALKRFRQLDSKCPGHPEYRWTSGVETTTGPLGQGLATSVGMAIAERWLAAYFNRPGFDLFDYDVYALCGDGCMMEGISSEAASLAGHLRLANLCWIYDNNHTTIEGNTALAYSDDVATRFIGYGWSVTRVGDANDLEMLERAFRTFKATTDRPTLIIVDSHIAYGAPNKQDTSAAHGEPLGAEEIRLTKRHYGWPEDAQFLVPDGVREHFREGMGAGGQALHAAWWAMFEDYGRQDPELADQGHRLVRRELPEGWDRGLPVFVPSPKGLATRDASGQALNAIARNHDSIGVGEDGPTHQPVEQLASLRAIPGLITLRPADANETVEVWRVIMRLRHQPAALILTRQAVPTLDRTRYAAADGVARGAYVLADAADGKPDVLLLATGSEVSLCLEAYETLRAEGIRARVVSMPSWELFEHYCRDHPEYRDQVLPPSVTARVSVEKASTLGWARYVGSGGHSVGMKTFGASAPLQELQKKFGFTAEHVVAAVRKQLAAAG
jgi:transketolase